MISNASGRELTKTDDFKRREYSRIGNDVKAIHKSPAG